MHQTATKAPTTLLSKVPSKKLSAFLEPKLVTPLRLSAYE